MNKEQRKQQAAAHLRKVQRTYGREIDDCVRSSIIYGGSDKKISVSRGTADTAVSVVDSDSVSAAICYGAGKTCIMNFASCRHPGGGFLNGSMAQEEALCHESILYPVLAKFQNYYEWNERHKNKSLYADRAIYTPEVIFLRDQKQYRFDVITCAAPNMNAAAKAGVTRRENTEVLTRHLDFVFRICEENTVDTLITGAFGCGVFKQDPREVARLLLNRARQTSISNVICAVPEGNRNLPAFKRVIAV